MPWRQITLGDGQSWQGEENDDAPLCCEGQSPGLISLMIKSGEGAQKGPMEGTGERDRKDEATARPSTTGRKVQTRVMRCEEGRSSNISWDGSSNWLAVGKSRQGGGILQDPHQVLSKP